MNWMRLLTSIVLCQLAGVIGAVFSSPAIPSWYALLKKPSFTPPNWLFGPAWITLYLLMALAAYMIWQKGLQEKGVSIALLIFSLQLLLNALWSPLFFGLRSPLCGAVVIIVLWLVLAITIVLFWKLSHRAALLLLPYLFWISYAAALNISIYLLNR